LASTPSSAEGNNQADEGVEAKDTPKA